MTAINQNFEMYAGDTKNIIIAVTDASGMALDLTAATVRWILKPPQPNAAIAISKSSPEIAIDIDRITIKLLPKDTETLFGNFYHEAELTDQIGNVSTIMVGTAKINRSFA